MAEKNKLTQKFKCPCCNKNITEEIRKNQKDIIRESKEISRKKKAKPKNELIKALPSAYDLLLEKTLREAKIFSLAYIKCPKCEKYLSCWINKVTGEVDNLKESTDLGFTNEPVGNLVIDDPFFSEILGD